LEPEGRRNHVLVVGIDAVTEKVLYQTEWFSARGMSFRILTTARAPGSITKHPSADIVPIPRGPIARIRQLVHHVRRERGSLHHVELYVGGRFAFVYALLCRVLRVPLLVVERGDLYYCIHKRYPLTTRLSIYASYRLADLIWLKELYMERWFASKTSSKTFLLPNAVPVPREHDAGDRDIDLLWVNRLVRERHPEWFAAALERLATKREVRTSILGVIDEAGPGAGAPQDVVVRRLTELPGVEVLGFVPPGDHYLRARFFVLPAEIVFANFSLLEAMSHGVVPIVSRVEGSDLIVDDGRNGFLADHSSQGLMDAIDAALDLDAERWRTMSAAARATIEADYGIDAWGAELSRRYDQLITSAR
jgi:glycosyltransferase involved in cell wall biosynthesis